MLCTPQHQLHPTPAEAVVVVQTGNLLTADAGRRVRTVKAAPARSGRGGGGVKGLVVTTATAGVILWQFTLTGPYVGGERKRCPDGSSMY